MSLPSWNLLAQSILSGIFIGSLYGLIGLGRLYAKLSEHLPPSTAAKVAAEWSGAPRKALYGGGNE